MDKPRTSQSGIRTDRPQYAATTQGNFDRVVSLHPESMQVVGVWSQLQGLEAPGYPNLTEVSAVPRVSSAVQVSQGSIKKTEFREDQLQEPTLGDMINLLTFKL